MERQPTSRADAVAGFLTAVGNLFILLGCLLPLVIVGIAFMLIAVDVIAGKGAVIASLVGIVLLFVLLAVLVARARSLARSRWYCPRCSTKFPAGTSKCPGCGVAIFPPGSSGLATS
jgi:hypothetical protein